VRAASRGCRGADTPVRAGTAAATRAAVVCLVNRQRSRHRLRALRELRRLDRSAQAWADTMVATGNFSHGRSPGARVAAHGYAWGVVGENIATGYATPRQVVAAWMASTGHCQNILDPRFTDIGGGVVRRGVGSSRGGRGTWTLDFALPRGEREPSRNWAPASGCPYHG
jgi:uncharacterized protein YkwD